MPDILRKSHRHVEGNERAKAKDELRHEIEDLDEDATERRDRTAPQPSVAPREDG